MKKPQHVSERNYCHFSICYLLYLLMLAVSTITDMLHKGFESVYHLKGGILKYLEVIPEAESLWSGECFVFDQRAAVSNGVSEGHYEFCRTCRAPISIENKNDNLKFEDGVSCLHCYDLTTEKKKGSARERNLQVRLASERKLKHLGYSKGKSDYHEYAKHGGVKNAVEVFIDDVTSMSS